MPDNLIKLALETIQLNKQALIFTPTRASAEKTAEEISKLTNFNLHELEKEVLQAASHPTTQCRRLSHCLKKGIAFHHSGLLSAQKELIEDNFRTGNVKLICCTPTLAAGVSLPAFRVLIKSLKRFSTHWGQDWIPVLEYMQMAGRAGRPEYEKFGEAISIAKDEAEKEEIHERYILGQPEEIYSKLAVEPVLRTYLLSLISSGIIRDEKTMMAFFSKTFWAHQFKDLGKLELIMQRMLKLLDEWKFVNVFGNEKEKEKSDFISALKIGSKEQKLQPTLLGKRISELYLDPLTAHHLLECLEKFDSSKNNFSLLQMIAHTLEMRPLLRIKAKEQEKMIELLVKQDEFFLEKEPSTFDLEYDEFMNSLKTALFLEAWSEEKDEDFLLEEFDVRPGEIRIKLDLADWLLYACEELSKINGKEPQLIREISKLRVRLSQGVKEELLPLIKLKGIGRVRARKLFANGLHDLGDLKKADLATLGQIIGKAVAEDVKKQLGAEVKEVPAGKRKGQLSLEKY